MQTCDDFYIINLANDTLSSSNSLSEFELSVALMSADHANSHRLADLARNSVLRTQF